jgi:hypothetical protein
MLRPKDLEIQDVINVQAQRKPKLNAVKWSKLCGGMKQYFGDMLSKCSSGAQVLGVGIMINPPPPFYYLACVCFKSWIDKLIFTADV